MQCRQKQIQDLMDEMYLKGIADHNISLVNVTIHDILKYLIDNYGNITPYDLEDNNKNMKEKWDATTPIEILFNQIKDAQDYTSAAGQPYTATQLLTTTYNLIYAT